MSRNRTVLYVDFSIGFGGSSKSLALTLRGLPDIRKLMITTQERPLVRSLFEGVRVWTFRRFVNYKTRDRVQSLVDRGRIMRAFRFPILKTYAVLDTVVSLVHALRMWYLIRRHDVDIVHMNNGFVPTEAIWAARAAGIPVIVHMRGIVSEGGARSLPTYMREVDCVISVSNAAGENLNGIMPADRLVTIYDPVDTAEATAALSERARVRQELGVSESDVLVGIFGRVVEWKGQREFVQAMLRALEQDPRLKAVVVGDVSDGPRSYLDEVVSLINASPFADRFILTGYRDDVARFYAALDIAVHASTEPEPFGMVIPEAMAAGVAVIATDAGGPREIFQHGVEGLRVPPRDVQAMAEAILSLSVDPERRHGMGERGKTAVVRRFTIEQNSANVRKIYESLWARRIEPASPAENLAGSRSPSD